MTPSGPSIFGAQGNSTAWAARRPPTTTYPVVTGMNGRFAMLTANNSGTSNVTTPTMTGGTNPPAGTYYARFLFRPNSLSATTQVNILTLRSNTTQRAAVQFRVNGGARQFRAVNATATLGTWTTLPGTFATTTVYTVKVTWSGTGTGSTSVTVTNGAASATSTAAGGGVNGVTVNNAVLGTSSGTAVTGQAYFDYYTASRFGMPA